MYVVDYVWIDGCKNIRSKIRILNSVDNLPDWTYDGSSTGEAKGEDSEIILKPRAIFKNPYTEKIVYIDVIVLCDTYTPNGEPTPGNKRFHALQIFEQKKELEPWFGLEQEYFLTYSEKSHSLGMSNQKEQGQYYCGVGCANAFGRKIVEEHMKLCLSYGIKLSGINAEVAPGQWEFQIGPCTGIEAGDHLWVARYLLYKVTEEYNVHVNIEPKPYAGKWNGSGCHTNYSTNEMRDGTTTHDGLYYINEAIDKLSHKHKEHMDVYGINNNKRMTGDCETASYDVFTNGVANRGASVRIGNETLREKKGYFEDRRPGSNCDPYEVTSIIFKTTCLD
jgi:glutamine synthetase